MSNFTRIENAKIVKIEDIKILERRRFKMNFHGRIFFEELYQESFKDGIYTMCVEFIFRGL